MKAEIHKAVSFLMGRGENITKWQWTQLKTADRV
jgi:hypothetical protein